MKKIFATLSVMLTVGTALAMPAKQGKKVLTLADGTQVTATLVGDEFMNWWESADGMKYVANEDGKYVAANIEVMKAAAEQRRAPISEARAKRIQAVQASKNAETLAGPLRSELGSDHITYEGKKKGIIILVDFSNQKFQDGHGNEYYNRVANERNLKHEDGYIGSVSDWFLAQSNGKFELDFDVKGPYHLKHTVSYYGKNGADGRTDTYVGRMIKDACDFAVEDGVNFNDYDWDGDGYADQVFVLYAGLGENAGGTSETVWPHEYKVRYTSIGKPLSYTADGKGKVDTYACANEKELVLNENGQFTSEQKLSGIGTICHEFSHCLGYPDMYDVAMNGQAGSNYGMGFFDVMCSGSYNGDGFIPCNYTGYERMYAGWTEPIVLEEPTTVTSMKSASDYGRPFVVYNDKNHKEYYVLENRQLQGWDAAIYANGLMITHVDYDATVWSNNAVNSSASDHQRCTIFHADNDDLETYYGIIGDLYPYINSKGVVANDELTDSSSPAANLYNINADGTKFMGKPITEIKRNGDGTMSFLFMDGSDDNIADNTTAIANVKADFATTTDNRVYSIDGRYLGNDINKLGKGLYITGGKKVVKN